MKIWNFIRARPDIKKKEKKTLASMAEHIKIARHINVTATRKSLVLPPMDWDFVTTSVTTLRILAGNIQE